MQPKSSPPPLRLHAKSRTFRYWRLANRCDDETAVSRGGGVDLQNVAEGEHQGHVVLANEGGCLFLLSGHVEPSFIGVGVTETFVSKGRITLNLRRYQKAFDVWLPACHACQEKFNWCSVAPTWNNDGSSQILAASRFLFYSNDLGLDLSVVAQVQMNYDPDASAEPFAVSRCPNEN